MENKSNQGEPSPMIHQGEPSPMIPKDGVLHFFEVKNGPYARMTYNQGINIPKLQQGASFTPIGKNAAEISDLNIYVLTKSTFKEKFEVHYIHYK